MTRILNPNPPDRESNESESSRPRIQRIRIRLAANPTNPNPTGRESNESERESIGGAKNFPARLRRALGEK